jgi:hypothetical protein
MMKAMTKLRLELPRAISSLNFLLALRTKTRASVEWPLKILPQPPAAYLARLLLETRITLVWIVSLRMDNNAHLSQS